MSKPTVKTTKKSVLIIEDDAAILEALEFNMRQAGYAVACATDGQEGLRQARLTHPDVVVLDLMLPGIDGIEVCRELRADRATKQAAIVMLTAKSEEVDQVVGFSVGADDYVTKPFSVKVLMHRVRALLKRRSGHPDEVDLLENHGIAIDRVGHLVTCGGVTVSLTPTEFRLLETLMARPGRAFSRVDLLDAAVGDGAIVLERTVDVHVRSLRRKLGAHARSIETVRGLGYRFARDAK